MSTDNPKSNDSRWFCPLYSFNCDCENVNLAEGIQIIPIPKIFLEYLSSNYSHHLKTLPSETEWVASIPVNGYGYFASNDLLEDLMTALRLHKNGRVVAGLLTLATFNNSEWTIGGHTSWTSVSSLDFFQETPIYKLRQSDLPKVISLFQQIRRWREAGILDGINIALERFHSSYHRSVEYRIVDQITAFESLYLGHDQELRYRLALRAAFLLGGINKKYRNNIFNFMKKAYKLRSNIVHGNNTPEKDILRPIVIITREFLRQSICKFLFLLSQGNTLNELNTESDSKLAKLDENILNNGETLILSD